MKTNYPTAEQVKQEFELRGSELWRKQRTDSLGKIYKAKQVNTAANYALGYCLVSCTGRTVLCHHLIWILCNGDIPAGATIDHINGVRDDNRIENLRLASMRDQNCNRPLHRDGKLPGCKLHKDYKDGAWEARLKVGARFVTVGFYRSEEEAFRHYRLAVSHVHMLQNAGCRFSRRQFRELIAELGNNTTEE